MEFEAVIGLEIHIELKTKSKMFSSAPVTYGLEPNTQIELYDLGFPGVMPSVNKQAVISAIRVCHALNMKIDDTLMFDRKNYFYSDLSKGYQITQQFRPIGREGHLTIKTYEGEKDISIERLHLEEDACKQLHYSNYTLIDYNRSGIPLIEIVSKPEIRSGEEAAKYVEKIRSIVTFLDVSNGKMEEGSLRCDTNVSVREKGSSDFGIKVEIKNVNGLTNIQRAIDYEIRRQTEILQKGEIVKEETRRYDENKKITVLMRAKNDPVDYKYFTDANIAPIKLSKEFIQEAISTSPELAEAKKIRYLSMGLNEYDSDLLISDVELSKYFDEAVRSGANPKLLANWINVNVRASLKRLNISINEFPITPIHLAELIKIIENGKISNVQARDLFIKMLEKKISPNKILEESDSTQISDMSTIQKLILETISENEKSVIDYKNGNERVVGFIVGQVLKKSAGKANPALTSKLVLEELKRR